MNEAIIFASVIIGVLFVYLVGVGIDVRSRCKHDFTNWAFSSTPGAFVQLRQCRKCGYTEVDQIKRVGEKHES